MKALILAAGYATRLYPLTENFPKPLLPVADRPIVAYLIEKLEEVSEVDHVYLVTNDRFADHFRAWSAIAPTKLAITVLNDGTKTNEDRLGAIGDIEFTIRTAQLTQEELIVLAGDNLFDFSLKGFVESYRRHPSFTAAVTVHELDDVAALRRTGVATLGSDGRVTSFVEKPSEPASNLAVPPFYIFGRGIGARIREYLSQGGNRDDPGFLLEWLVKQTRVYGYRFDGRRYDIGDLESYRRTQAIFSDRT